MNAIARTSLIVAICLVPVGTAAAAQCKRVGGWGTGVVEGVASFMAEAALKNSAKAWGGDRVKIGTVSQKCGWKTVSYECTADARACK